MLFLKKAICNRGVRRVKALLSAVTIGLRTMRNRREAVPSIISIARIAYGIYVNDMILLCLYLVISSI